VTCNVRQLNRSDEPGTYYELTVVGQKNTRRLLETGLTALLIFVIGRRATR
jgi:hypothetical protein